VTDTTSETNDTKSAAGHGGEAHNHFAKFGLERRAATVSARFGQAAPARALDAVLEACELGALAQRAFHSLSSGEQQRAQFARGWLQLWRPPEDRAPRWLLLDEPNANLDVAHGLALLEDLRSLAGHGLGVLAVLHDLDLAVRYADRIVLLDGGEVVACGTPESVMTADRLSAVYGTPVHVEQHAALERLVVIA